MSSLYELEELEKLEQINLWSQSFFLLMKLELPGFGVKQTSHGVGKGYR